MPKIIAVTEDAGWGQPGSSKKVIAAKSPAFQGGVASTDHVLERIENAHWKIEVRDFTAWMLGFYAFTGTWDTKEIAPGKVEVNYSYVLHARQPLFYPLAWMFAHLFWKKYMRRVIENVRQLAYSEEPYMYP